MVTSSGKIQHGKGQNAKLEASKVSKQMGDVVLHSVSDFVQSAV